MALIGRLIAICFGIGLACLAAGSVVLMAVLFPDWSSLELGPLDDSRINMLMAFGLVFVSGFALVPALIVVIVTETFGIRRLLAYGLGGAVSGAACYLGLVPFDTDTMSFVGIIRRDLEVMTAAGIVAGVVYWLIAGRNAGSWRAPPPASDPARGDLPR